MAPRTLCDDGCSQPPYGSKRMSARTRQPQQLSFRQAPALLRRPRGNEDETGARVRPLAPSPAWTLVTPYCKRTRPGRGTNTKAAGFPPLSRPSPAAFLPPFALGLAPTHLGWGTQRHFTRRPRDPRSRNADRHNLFPQVEPCFLSPPRAHLVCCGTSTWFPQHFALDVAPGSKLHSS
jgi:hypothetical protein